MGTTTARRHRTGTTHGPRWLTVVVAMALAPALAGCPSGSAGAGDGAVTTATVRATSTVRATPTLEPERDVAVGDRHFKARCAGSGPSVVLVADYGRAMDDAWGTIPQTLATRGRVCVYDRLGVGRSDSVPDRQTFASLAGDLDGVISGLGLTRPVVVLGDSLGAPIALTWTSRHASDAKAVVLLDPVPPGYFGPTGALLRLLPPKDPGDPELGGLWADLDRFNTVATNRESLDPASWTAYERLPMTSTPLYDLVRAQVQPWPAAVDADAIDGVWRQYQRRVLALSSQAELRIVPKPDDWPTMIRSALERALQS
ncbi:alpha/beta hydrolase [Terracoccus sp. 273MFTsu3.1]|uniref:alpha/beta hydrolase n=1 Tax=Terracoccus sp. 273MFTsu3.1 TaxID=1172188 RepID=UPI00035CCDB2|nr:alpha/beta fold hydrolase [Terracoccus sp. 273MFTsu3.1]